MHVCVCIHTHTYILFLATGVRVSYTWCAQNTILFGVTFSDRLIKANHNFLLILQCSTYSMKTKQHTHMNARESALSLTHNLTREYLVHVQRMCIQKRIIFPNKSHIHLYIFILLDALNCSHLLAHSYWHVCRWYPIQLR